MKKSVFKIALVTIGLFVAKQSHAQYTQSGYAPSTAPAGTQVKIVKVEPAKDKVIVVDKIYKNKYGPAGQTIFIDKDSHYYYLDPKGVKVYCTKDKLKSKRDK